MKKLDNIHNIAVIKLHYVAIATASILPKIGHQGFVDADFQQKVELLKRHYENLLINSKQYIDSFYVAYTDEIAAMNEEIKVVSDMIRTVVSMNSEDSYETGQKLIKCFLHDDSNPSMTWGPKSHGFHCFGCMVEDKNLVFDIFNMLQLLNGFSGPTKFKDAYKIAVKTFVEDGMTINKIFGSSNNTYNKNHSNYIPYTKEMNRVRHYKFHHQIDQPELRVAETKLLERGISLKTAKNNAVMLWLHSDMDGKSQGALYFVFINDDASYTRRLCATDENLRARLNLKQGSAQKWKNPANKPVGIFNTRFLAHCRQYNEVCYVTESAFDALSVIELGYHSIGLNSVANASKFFKEHVDNEADTMLICLLDNDDAGKKSVPHFQKRNLFVPDYLQENYTGNRWLSRFKDINEALVADKVETLQELSQLEEDAKAFYAEKGL